MKVVWSRVAIDDLQKLRAYIAEDDPDAATRIARRLVDAVDQLANFPGMGRPGRRPHTRELLVPGTPCLVPYRVVDNVIQIIAVIHMSRQWPDR